MQKYFTSIFLLILLQLANNSFAANYAEGAWFDHNSNLRQNNVVFLGEKVRLDPIPLDLSILGQEDTLGNLKAHMVDEVKLFTRNGHIDVTNNPKYGTLNYGHIGYYFGDESNEAIIYCSYTAPEIMPDETALEVEMTSVYQPGKVCKFTIYVVPRMITVTFHNEEVALCCDACLMEYKYETHAYSTTWVNDDLSLEKSSHGSYENQFSEPVSACKDGMTVELNQLSESSTFFYLNSGKLKVDDSGIQIFYNAHFKEHDEFEWKISAYGMVLFQQDATPGSEFDMDFVLPPKPWKSAFRDGNKFKFIPEYYVNEQMKSRQNIYVEMTK